MPNPRFINIATEDVLSEAVAIRLIEEMNSDFQIELKLRSGGSGYLRSKLDSFCQMAKRTPMLLLTDLDDVECAPSLISEWFGKTRIPPKLLFRVPVREVEAWLLADHQAMKGLLGARAITTLPDNPELLRDPKESLLEFAKKAPREVRMDLVAAKGAVSSQGLGYNDRLTSFVRDKWSPERASLNSDSLRRTRERLRELI